MTKRNRRRQRGAALLLLMLIVIVATSSLLLLNLNRDALRVRQLTDTSRVLAMARTALLDYALVNDDLNSGRSISFPCPDLDDFGGFDDGQAHTTACGVAGETVIGRLPWRTLGVTALKDVSAACLWYVVSGSYKDADLNSAAMINSDSNGLLQLFSVDSGNVVVGATPNERPVAMVIAAMRPLNGQTRPAVLAGTQCAPGAVVASYLDSDTAVGISNATLGGVVDGVDAFATAANFNTTHNDRFVTVTRTDIAQRVSRRSDFEPGMRSLGLAAAACLSNYAATNPGGVSDKRLPWPAPVQLADYRTDTAYDDAAVGNFSGRLPDIVNDSNATTNNPIARVLSECDGVAVPAWTPAMRSKWQHWKDHFFYAVAGSYSPLAVTPSVCSSCLTVNGSGQYAAVLIFSNQRLNSLGQVRDAPPTDSDTKRFVVNYLEGDNAGNVPGSSPTSDYVSQAATSGFNDLLFCIDDQLLVSEC